MANEIPGRDWFEGRIASTLDESEPHFRPNLHPGDDAPNVLVILYDDLGFSHLNCYGSTLHTPNADRLAAGGVRFTNFHVTPLCSPTRAALLTGRNHHTVGMRAVSNMQSGFPSATGEISLNAATIGEVLQSHGYGTWAVGKWHLMNMENASAAGPFHQWPTQRGFDRFYGFLQGETDQFHPELTYDQHHIDPPKTAEEGYHVTEDLVDRAIGFIHDSKSVRPDRPFFGYVSIGAMHAPHQAPQEYLDKYRGAFDEGWDEFRQRWYERQLEMGIIPEGTQLAPRNDGVNPWDSLSDNEKKLFARFQEAFAAFLDHTDVQIGRLLDTLDRLGELDNTLVILTSDNGASQEGGPNGQLHEMLFFNMRFDSADEMVHGIDDVGGPNSHPNYPWGWAQAGNCPNKWYKQNTHAGGVRSPLIMHWPERIGDAGGLRHQFHHVIDIAPTIFEAIGITPPDSYNGHDQIPVAGTPVLYAVEDPHAPTTRTTQYFEMMGHRGIVEDGWKAVTRRNLFHPDQEDTWELYYLPDDFSECNDLADQEPQKLEHLIDLWWQEMDRHGGLPHDTRTLELFRTPRQPHTPHATDRYRYVPPVSHLPGGAEPAIGGRSWTMTASVTRATGEDGILFTTGTQNSGLVFFVKDDRLCFDYNAFGDHTFVTSETTVPDDAAQLTARFERTGRATGSIELRIDGDRCGRADVPWVMRMTGSIGADVGKGTHSPVSPEIDGPFPFEGTLHELVIDLDPSGSRRERDEQAAARYDSEMSKQ
ncbi:MAG: arylsulfatase [Acidimicrobiales bacterium]|nr:arylsulfatase [Acidimicrobiales bacterium]